MQDHTEPATFSYLDVPKYVVDFVFSEGPARLAIRFEEPMENGDELVSALTKELRHFLFNASPGPFWMAAVKHAVESKLWDLINDEYLFLVQDRWVYIPVEDPDPFWDGLTAVMQSE